MTALPEQLLIAQDAPLTFSQPTSLPMSYRHGVLLLGNFDGMHRGHAALVKAGKECALRLRAPLGIMQCNPHPRAFFGSPGRYRVSSGRAQAYLIASYGFQFIYAPNFDAGFVAISPEDFIEAILLRQLNVAAIVAGSDFRFGYNRGGDIALLKTMTARHGVECRILADEMDETGRISTSKVRGKISEGDIKETQRLLGHPWITEIFPVKNEIWRFSSDQILPPAGRWPVSLLDDRGIQLGDRTLSLDSEGQARMEAPENTAFIRWSPKSGARSFPLHKGGNCHVR